MRPHSAFHVSFLTRNLIGECVDWLKADVLRHGTIIRPSGLSDIAVVDVCRSMNDGWLGDGRRYRQAGRIEPDHSHSEPHELTSAFGQPFRPIVAKE